MSVLRVAEMFASFQGEGPSAGQRAAFIRLSGCGVGCSWCDEPQTWDWSRFSREQESSPATVDEACAWAVGTGAGLVVITGGEPLAQQRAVTGLAGALAAAGLRVEVETSGTVIPARFLIGPDGVLRSVWRKDDGDAWADPVRLLEEVRAICTDPLTTDPGAKHEHHH